MSIGYNLDKHFKQYLRQAAILDGSRTTWAVLVIDAVTELRPIVGLAVLCYMALC